jgi:membrane-associated phospholipid phosphatase
MDSIIYNTGQYGPFILYIATVYTLWGKNNSLLFFIFGQFINWLSNSAIKNILKIPRPNLIDKSYVLDKMSFIELMQKDVYGMPSGHAQTSSFATYYTYLVTKDSRILILFIGITLIVMWQRVYNKFHTLFQVSVGAIIGICNAVLFASLNKSLLV